MGKSPSHSSQHCLAHVREGVLYPPTSVGASYLEYVHVLMYELMKMPVLLYNVCRLDSLCFPIYKCLPR